MASSSSTPVRAIHTPLLTRAAPSVPLPNTTYEPYVKNVLRFRLVYKVFLYTALYAWFITFCITTYADGFGKLGTSTLLVPFRLSTVIHALLCWSTTAMPVSVLRKIYLTPTRNFSTSFAKYLKTNISKPSTSRMFAVYTASAVISLALNVMLSNAFGYTDHGLTVFVKSKKHPLYLNGRLLFVFLVQLFVAAAYTLRNALLERFVFRWEDAKEADTQPSMNGTRILVSARKFATGSFYISTIGIALVAVPSAVATFGLIRLALPVLYKLPLLHYLIRPFTAHFLRGPWTISLPFYHKHTIARALYYAFKVLLDWEVANVFFESIIYKPIAVRNMAPEPHVALVAGCSSADLIYRYVALNELQTIASGESTSAQDLRSAIFNDQKYNPNLWNHLVREGLLFLGKDYQFFLRRGKPPAPEVKPPPAPPSTPASSIATPMPLLRTSIFQSSKSTSPIRNVVESLGSDGPLAKALDAGAEAVHIPELFKSVENVVLPAPKKEEVMEAVEKVVSIPERAKKWAKEKLWQAFVCVVPVDAVAFVGDVNTWLHKERVDKYAKSYLPHVEVDVVVVEVLSHLICASLAEDKYGVVQRDIPRTLEAMLSFITAIEEYHSEVRKHYTPPTEEQERSLTLEQRADLDIKRIEVEKAGEILRLLSDALRLGVGRIVRTFGDKLLAFKFPPRIAQKLQPFMEFC